MNVNVQRNISITERYEGRVTGSAHGYADFLADRLSDHANIALLRVLAAQHPRELLEDALRRTMAIPAATIRKTRGACFTGVVRLLARNSNPNAYDGKQTPAP